MAIRNNVVIVMCDLCIRYTTMADRYIPDISVCLKDPEPFIRRQTLILLTNLLQASEAGRGWVVLKGHVAVDAEDSVCTIPLGHKYIVGYRVGRCHPWEIGVNLFPLLQMPKNMGCY